MIEFDIYLVRESHGALDPETLVALGKTIETGYAVYLPEFEEFAREAELPEGVYHVAPAVGERGPATRFRIFSTLGYAEFVAGAPPEPEPELVTEAKPHPEFPRTPVVLPE